MSRARPLADRRDRARSWRRRTPEAADRGPRIVARGAARPARRDASLLLLFGCVDGLRGARSSSSTRSTASRTRRSASASSLGLALAFLAAALHRDRASGSSSPRSSTSRTRRRSTRRAGGARARSSRRAATRFTRKRLVTLAGARRGRRRSALALVAPLRLARPGVRHRARSRETPWRRGRRLVDEDGRPLHGRRRSRRARSTPRTPSAPTASSSARRSSSCACRRGARAAAGREGWAPQRDPRLLEDLHARGLRDRALPQADSSPTAEPRPALVCPCHYSTFDPATGGTVIFGPAGRAAAAAAARGRRRRAPARRRATSAARSARPGGASAIARCTTRDPPSRPLRRPARRHGAVAAQDAALRLPRPLVVPARRGRALLVPRRSSARAST